MEHLKIPEGYSSPLTIRETEVAIKEVKDHFERALAKSLHLTRVSAPLFVLPQSGMNDNLNGIERPVSFGIKEQDDACAEIVHSLAKWKRYALKKYGFHSGEGLYTDMTAIRRDEDTDNIHRFFICIFQHYRKRCIFTCRSRRCNARIIIKMYRQKRNNKKRKDLSHQITQKSDTSGFCAYQLADRCS